MTGWLLAALPGFLLWTGLLLLPWRPWSTRERLDADGSGSEEDMSEVTALVPARNEAQALAATLPALAAQGRGLRIVLVDDQSEDGTAQAALATGVPGLTVVRGSPTRPGWAGKVWALAQGFARVRTRLTLLVDADIALSPGLLAALRRRLDGEGMRLVSLVAELPMQGFWKKLLLPAFVYFFKLLYPFSLANDARWRRFAAAAGGCVLVDTRTLRRIGGFMAIRSALIDDCALARAFKAQRFPIWIGLTRSAVSVRSYRGLSGIWDAVARFAFEQLRYSIVLLALLTAAFLLAFVALPLALLAAPHAQAKMLAFSALIAMAATYLPTLRYYGRSSLWVAALPGIGMLYLAMTWTSAWWYWRGSGVQWKGRRYRLAGARTAVSGP
jgi:hopene-associated glycosyltransferase HpnB